MPHSEIPHVTGARENYEIDPAYCISNDDTRFVIEPLGSGV